MEQTKQVMGKYKQKQTNAINTIKGDIGEYDDNSVIKQNDSSAIKQNDSSVIKQNIRQNVNDKSNSVNRQSNVNNR